jgi:hypothetical protein
VLQSLTADKNDVTQESGWWMNSADMKATAKTAAKIEVLRKEASQAEK